MKHLPIKQRLLLVLIAFAIVLLALGAWAAQGLRLALMAWPQQAHTTTPKAANRLTQGE